MWCSNCNCSCCPCLSTDPNFCDEEEEDNQDKDEEDIDIEELTGMRANSDHLPDVRKMVGFFFSSVSASIFGFLDYFFKVFPCLGERS